MSAGSLNEYLCFDPNHRKQSRKDRFDYLIKRVIIINKLYQGGLKNKALYIFIDLLQFINGKEQQGHELAKAIGSSAVWYKEHFTQTRIAAEDGSSIITAGRRRKQKDGEKKVEEKEQVEEQGTAARGQKRKATDAKKPAARNDKRQK